MIQSYWALPSFLASPSARTADGGAAWQPVTSSAPVSQPVDAWQAPYQPVYQPVYQPAYGYPGYTAQPMGASTAAIAALKQQLTLIQIQLNALLASTNQAAPRPVSPRSHRPDSPSEALPKLERRPQPEQHEPRRQAPKQHEPHGKGPLARKGARGKPVTALQNRLDKLGFDPGGVDGIFGPKTLAAVKRFQKARGLEADGIVGPKTWKELDIRVSGKVTYPSNTTGGPAPKGLSRRDGHLMSNQIVDRYDRMVAAAKADGVTLRITSAYRSYAEQVVLWNRYGRDPRRVARPGTSNHESGLAIDFTNTPGAWAWLKRNAARFGMHNYPPEPWHYSPTGT